MFPDRTGQDDARWFEAPAAFSRRSRLISRIIVAVMLAALTFAVCLGVYLFLERRVRPAGAYGQPADLAQETLRAQLTVLLAVLLATSLVILVFAIGAYLLLRAGQTLSQQRLGARPSTYVDAWSQYRLTDEQISNATQEKPDNPPAGNSAQEPDHDSDPRA
jgi:hypothetical protein